MYFRKAALALIFALLTAGAAAQKPTRIVNLQTGPAIDPELKAAMARSPSPDKFPDSNYARILDLASVEIKPDGTMVADYRESLRIFNERGRQMAEVSLPYNSSYQTLTVTRARTIKKDGRVVDVSPSDIRTATPYSDYAMYDDSVAVGFSMPGVEDGCVIDYSWREVTKPVLMPGNFWDYWGFSGPEPVSLSRYTLRIPAARTFQYKVYNNDGLKPIEAASADGKTKTYTWQMTDMKPVESEPSMPDRREAQVWMEVTTLKSWQDIAGWFWKLARPQMADADAIKQTVDKVTAGKTTTAEKAAAIYDWVANAVRYVGIEFGLSAYKPHAAPEVQSKLYGDCKDKATLLITMLRQIGVKAYPVLLHADERSHTGEQLPTLNAFDHCIAVADVDGRETWLDATAETCAYGDVPQADRGCEVLVVRDGTGQFERIPNFAASDNGFDSDTKVALNPDGSADVQTETRMRGASAQQWRSYVRSITPEQRKQMVQAMAQAFSAGVSVQKYTLPDGQDKAGPFVMNMALAAPSRARRTRNLLIVPISNAVAGQDRQNPFVKDKRIWPIVVEEASRQHGETTITVPQGFTVEDIPSDLDLNCGLFSYHRGIAVSPDGRTIKVAVTSTANPGRVPASDYGKIRSYYDSVLNAMDDPIVLRRAGKA